MDLARKSKQLSTLNGAAGAQRQGRWIENGLIDAGGDHEPYIFVVRRGGQRLDARKNYEYEQSEKLIRQLKHDPNTQYLLHGVGELVSVGAIQQCRRQKNFTRCNANP